MLMRSLKPRRALALVAALALLPACTARQGDGPAPGGRSGTGATPADTQAGEASMRPTFDQVVAVQERHVHELMAVTGVVAVGVGMLQDGRYSINVSLAHDDPQARKQIPKELEGVPVVVEVTGPIRPLRP